MLSKLISMGFPVVHFDAQTFANQATDTFVSVVSREIAEANRKEKPLIVVVEELDKLPEITKNGEVTFPLVGAINEILSDGRISLNGTITDARNIMVITTMNFAPEEMEKFTEEVLSSKKSFYDLSISDMEKFSEWIRSEPSARYKILSHLFRSNTVRRIAPFTVIMQPLLEETYREIIKNVVDEAIKRNTTGKNRSKRVKIVIDDSVIDFLFSKTVYAPSGAGETVLRADAITDQLINFAIKATSGPKDDSLDRPRSAKIAVDSNNEKAKITVTPYVYHHPNLEPLENFEVEVEFDRNSGLFMPPSNLAVKKPAYQENLKSPQKKSITVKETSEFRYGKNRHLADGLEDAINLKLLGQAKTVGIVKDEMEKFMGRSLPSKKEPSFKVLSGFPGIGKSEMVKLVANHLKLPLIKVNMQQFASDDPKAVEEFFATVAGDIARLQPQIAEANGKFIFLIEELDKVFEINPSGSTVNRPVMAAVKDLLNDGKSSVSTQRFGNRLSLDISPAFTFVTMNFSIDRFNFSADPRMTTIDDVVSAWQKLNSSVAAIKQLLGSMFLPETVSRLISQFIIMKPLTASDYLEVINNQLEATVASRFYDENGRDVGKIKIEFTNRYRKYLFNESVIPSEGARTTVVRSQSLISTDLEKAVLSLPKSKFGTKPIVMSFDFYPGASEVVVRAHLEESSDANKSIIILRKPVSLSFPRIDIKGKIPQERLVTSAHEFGHALSAIRLGLRIEQVVVVPTTPGAGGYVKFKGNRFSATDQLAEIYVSLASRAMERMIFSKDPKSPLSVMEVSAGPSLDIKQATMTLYNMIYELGFDPFGGTIDRNFSMNGSKYASYESLPSSLAAKLGRVLRLMEDQVLEDLMSSHSKEWFVEKITSLARKGAMDERQFYELVDYVYPGDNAISYGRSKNIIELFKGVILKNPKSVEKAKQDLRGRQSENVEKIFDRFMSRFIDILKVELHDNPDADVEFMKKNKSGVFTSCRNLF